MIDQLPILLILIPLFAAPLLVLLGSRQLALPVSLGVVWSVFGVAVALLVRVTQSGPFEYELGGWPSPYGIVYIVDHLSAFVMTFVAALGAIVLTYAPPSINKEIPYSKPVSYTHLTLPTICSV